MLSISNSMDELVAPLPKKTDVRWVLAIGGWHPTQGIVHCHWPALRCRGKPGSQRCRASGGRIDCFVDPESGSLRTIAEEQGSAHGFQRAPVPTDPGSSGRVLPTNERNDVPIVEIQKSRHGYAYEAVGGHMVINEGQRNAAFVLQPGDFGSIDAQVAAVKKSARAVSELVDSGHRVVLNAKNPYIEHAEGGKTRLRRQIGMWYLHCWKIPNDIAIDQPKFNQRFQTQGPAHLPSSV